MSTANKWASLHLLAGFEYKMTHMQTNPSLVLGTQMEVGFEVNPKPDVIASAHRSLRRMWSSGNMDSTGLLNSSKVLVLTMMSGIVGTAGERIISTSSHSMLTTQKITKTKT
jgi:hypothetical protein